MVIRYICSVTSLPHPLTSLLRYACMRSTVRFWSSLSLSTMLSSISSVIFQVRVSPVLPFCPLIRMPPVVRCILAWGRLLRAYSSISWVPVRVTVSSFAPSLLIRGSWKVCCSLAQFLMVFVRSRRFPSVKPRISGTFSLASRIRM